MAPMLVPPTKSMGMCRWRMASMTPMCARPRARPSAQHQANRLPVESPGDATHIRGVVEANMLVHLDAKGAFPCGGLAWREFPAFSPCSKTRVRETEGAMPWESFSKA